MTQNSPCTEEAMNLSEKKGLDWVVTKPVQTFFKLQSTGKVIQTILFLISEKANVLLLSRNTIFS